MIIVTNLPFPGSKRYLSRELQKTPRRKCQAEDEAAEGGEERAGAEARPADEEAGAAGLRSLQKQVSGVVSGAQDKLALN